ncbi:MAG: hypothetical protein J6B16_00915 [Clostridia bacterium]|nr:hypothetical protein [Clostridia bacterium]
MDNFFTQQEFDSVKKQRLSAIIMIVLVLTVYFALFITTIISYLRLPYQDAKGNLYKAMLYVVTVVVIVYLYIFIGIRYKRVNKYYKMLCGVFNGTCVKDTGKFISFSDTLETKDGVDVKHMIFSVYIPRRANWYERVIYIPYERDFPPFIEGQDVIFTSQSNILISYEILDEK